MTSYYLSLDCMFTLKLQVSAYVSYLSCLSFPDVLSCELSLPVDAVAVVAAAHFDFAE